MPTATTFLVLFVINLIIVPVVLYWYLDKLEDVDDEDRSFSPMEGAS